MYQQNSDMWMTTKKINSDTISFPLFFILFYYLFYFITKKKKIPSDLLDSFMEGPYRTGTLNTLSYGVCECVVL